MSWATEENEKKSAIAFMIKEVEAEMKDNDFQRDFFESLSEQFASRGKLSEKQSESMIKIYERVTGEPAKRVAFRPEATEFMRELKKL